MAKDKYLEKATGQRFIMDVTAHLSKDNIWKAIGKGTFSITEDGENWVTKETEIASLDKDLDAAVATVMLSVSNYIIDDAVINEFETELKVLRKNE